VKKVEIIKTRLDLLDKICGSARSVKQQVAVYSTIIEMARFALNAAAASVLLFDEHDKTSINRFSDGPLGRQVTKLTTGQQLGVAGLVLQTGKSFKMDAIDEDPRFGKLKEAISGVLVRSAVCVPLVSGGKVIGILEVFNKLDGNAFTETDFDTMNGLAAGTTLTIANAKANESQLFIYRRHLQKLVIAADSRELSESKHARRVANYALIAAKELSMSPELQQVIEYGAILHDIGMFGVPSAILEKKEKLTAEDWNAIRKHPVIGFNLLRGMPSLNQVSKIILYHHERFDGKGYPCGLKGETIPLESQLISVAEAFDAMTVAHTYRAATTPQEAMKELGRFSGTQFNPDAVKALCMGNIRHQSRDTLKVKEEVKKIDYFKNQHGEANTWKINFNQNARIGAPVTVGEPD